MKKTYSTNIGGTIFDVEEDAYQQLTAYLRSVEAHFQSYQDAKDIVADIEARVAEQLSQKAGQSRIVTLDDVSQVVAAMGSVEQFGDAEVAGTQPPAATGAVPGGVSRRRLFRDRDERVIGGVASGIAAYFDLSPAWIRLLFVSSLFLGGTGLIVYLILWVCVPPARTMTDKLRMRGVPVTLATIDQSARGQIMAAPPRTWSMARTFVHVLIIGVVALALICMGMCIGGDGWSHSWTYTLGEDQVTRRVRLDTLVTVAGIPTVALSTVAGDIHVTTWPRAQVKIVANTEGDEYVDFGIVGSDIHIKERSKHRTCQQCRATYDVVVPIGTSLFTETVSGAGAHHLAGTQGPVHATSVSGDIEIANAREVTAKTVSGDIAIRKKS